MMDDATCNQECNHACMNVGHGHGHGHSLGWMMLACNQGCMVMVMSDDGRCYM